MALGHNITSNYSPHQNLSRVAQTIQLVVSLFSDSEVRLRHLSLLSSVSNWDDTENIKEQELSIRGGKPMGGLTEVCVGRKESFTRLKIVFFQNLKH